MKNIKTGEYLRFYSFDSDKFCDTNIIENAKSIKYIL